MVGSAPRRVRKRSWFLLGFVFVVVSLAAATQHPYVRGQVHARVATAIREELGLTAEFGGVRFAFPFGIAGDYLSLTHPEHGLFASADTVEIRPSLWALLRGEIDLKRILVEGVRVRLRVVDGEIVNLPEPPVAKGKRRRAPDEPVRIPLDELVVQKARLILDGGDELNGSLHGVNAVVRVVDGVRVRVQLSIGGGDLHTPRGDERVNSVVLTGAYSPEKIEVERLRVDTSLAKLAVDKAELGLPAEHGRYRGHVVLDTQLEGLARLPLELDLPQMNGHVKLDAQVDGAGERYHVRGKFHGDNPELMDFGFGILDLDLDVTPDEVRVLPGSQSQIPLHGGVVGLEGRLGLGPTLPLTMKVDVKMLEFHKLMDMLNVTDDCIVNWHLKGGFTLNGTIAPLNIAGPIWADHLFFKALDSAWHDPKAEEVIGTPPGRVSGRVSVRPDALRFENLKGHLPHSEMLVNVHVGFDEKIGVTAQSDSLDLRDATGLVGMPLTGAGAFSLDVGGSYENTTLTGMLDLADFSIDGFRLGHMRTSAVMEKDGVAVRFVDTRIEKNDSRYIIDDMLLDFSEQFSIDATARIDRLSLADFYHTFELENDPDFAPYQGHLRGTASARYTLGFPGDSEDGTLRVDTAANINDLSIYGQNFRDGRLEGSWTWKRISEGTRGARLELDEFVLKKGKGTVEARGTMDYGGKLALTLFAESIMVRDLEAVSQQKLDVNGELNFVGQARGTPWVPEIALDVDLVGASLGRRAIDDAHFVFRASHKDDPWTQAALKLALDAKEPCLRARRALASADWTSEGENGEPGKARAIMLCGKGFDDKLAFDVALGIADDLPARGVIAFRGVPMAWAFPRPPKATPVRGALTGQVELRGGSLAKPDSLLGSIEVPSVTFGQDQTWLENDGPVSIALTGEGARITRARFTGHGSAVDVSGGASFDSGLATHVAGRFDMAILAAFTPAITRSTGYLTLDVNITGKAADPSVYGRATLSEGSLLLRDYNQPLDKVNAKLSFSEREVLLEEMSADAMGGSVRLHGSATLRDQALDHYELFINARDVDYAPMGGVELSFSGDAKLAFSPGARIPELSGVIRLSRARYTRPFSLGISERISGFSQAKRVVRDTYDPAKDTLALDLRVVEDAPIRVTNNLINADFSIEDREHPFRIVGTDQRVGMLGTLSLERGTLSFRSSEFVIEEGTVDFIDEHSIRPRLDIHARTQFRRTADASGARWWISLHAFGEADDLKLETSSEPALAQEDIALLLTVGLTRAEAERLGTSELTQGAALEALATVTGVDREVKRALPVIDDFAVTSAYSARSNRTEPQVVVGKRLSDKVRATATTGLTADSNFKTGVEVRLDDQTSVEAGYDNVQTTTSSQFGNVGVDLRWRLEFD